MIPARRPGRVGSRRDPSDGQVDFVVRFSIPLPRRGAGAFIVSVVDHSYLVTLLLLWPTMPSYPSTTLAVLAVRRAFTGRRYRPYLCQIGCTTTGAPHTCIRPVARVGSITSMGQLSEGMMTWCVGRAGELGEVCRSVNDVAGAELISDHLETILDPTEHELGNCNVARVDPTEHELGNCDVARVDLTEQELGNCGVARVDPTEQELENRDVARVDPTEQELGNCDVGLLPRVNPGASPGIWPRE
ncbi:hypothetical protein BHM03_00048939 [Ensete ventricosum]|nr:hypothetical protein BHM03_00048939 [Ensete ventricosum]